MSPIESRALAGLDRRIQNAADKLQHAAEYYAEYRSADQRNMLAARNKIRHLTNKHADLLAKRETMLEQISQ